MNAKAIRISVLLIFVFGLGQLYGRLYAQQILLSPRARVSILTCGPGTELYSTFGHSAFRVWDPAQNIDWVYNYGTFDFNTPNFYMKFARGKLDYALSKSVFSSFLYTYQIEQRWVQEQVLALSATQEQALFNFLEQNAKPENRYYRYDFLFENCATKIPDILLKVFGDSIRFTPYQTNAKATFRELIQENLNPNSWSSFGIDLALGAVIDRNATLFEHTFLPKYVYKQLEYGEIYPTALVANSKIILDLPEIKPQVNFWTSPLFWFCAVLIISLMVTYRELKMGIYNPLWDVLLLAGTGLAGIIIFFLWFLTDHSATAWNFNILWANPLNLLAAVQIFRNKHNKFVRRFALLALQLLVLCPLIWFIGIQGFSAVLVPIWASLALRYSSMLRTLIHTS
ncbi:MAG: hypothetical protein RLZZ241_810 [Bacteroidota bacterium]|jgi:hypothetical protein